MSDDIYNILKERFYFFRDNSLSNQKAFEDMFLIAFHFDEEKYYSCEELLYDGLLIVAEHGKKFKFDLYKLSDAGIEYMNFRIFL